MTRDLDRKTEDTPIEINSSPLSDPVDDSEVINISSDSDSDAATIPYVTSPSPPSCEHDVWSIKSGTSGKSISILLKEWDQYFLINPIFMIPRKENSQINI